MEADLKDFAQRMLLLEFFHNFPPQPSRNPFHVKSSWTPPSNRDPALDAFLHAVEQDIFNTPLKSVRDNLSKDERIDLKQFHSRTDIIIKPADKGSRTVTMKRDWFINEC